MFLKSLEIQGFKSFADKVQFTFSPGVTAIVGPNGSGKSNVVDAIRWVLGEQSAKTLRGAKMEDVIFSGSAGRKPVGMARVTMILDNSQRVFALDADEIEVSRTLYRSGESHYMLNKNTCRLKDIQELFMDTGLGKDGFSVIGQGKIEEILTLHAEERRGLIEEAAGISKYKYRKREAERKLASTNDDMTRLDDILYELEQRIDPLAEQAEKVRVYRGLKAESDALHLAHLTRQYLDHQEKQRAQRAALDTAEQEAVAAQTRLDQLEAGLSETKQALAAERHQRDDTQAAYTDALRETQRHETELTRLSERQQNITARLGALTADMEENARKLTAAAEEAATLAEGLEAAKTEAETARAASTTAKDALNASESEVVCLKQALEDGQAQQFERLSVQATVNNTITRLEQTLHGEQARRERVASRVAALAEQKAQLDEEYAARKAEQTDRETTLETASQQLDALTAEIGRAREALTSQQQAQQALAQQYMQAKSRLDTLEEFEASGEGYYQGVQAVLRAKKEERLQGIQGSILQLLEIPTAYLTAIENALGGAAQNVVVTSDRQAQQAIDWLKKERRGRVTFMPQNLVKGKRQDVDFHDEAVLGLALDLVHYDPQYESVMAQLLGRVWILRDLASATALAKKTGAKYRFVTLEGDVIAPGGSMTGGHQKKQSSIVYRKHEMGTLKEKIAALSAQGTQLKQAIHDQQAALAALETQQTAAREEVQSHQLKLREAAVVLDQLQSQVRRLEREQTLETMNAQDLNAAREKAEEELAAARKEAEGIGQALSEIVSSLAAVRLALSEAEQVQQEAQAALQGMLVRAATMEEQYQHHRQRAHAAADAERTLQTQAQRMNSEKQELDAEQVKLAEALAGEKAALADAQKAHVQIDTAMQAVKDKIDGFEQTIREQEQAENEARRHNDACWHARNAAEMSLTRSEEKLAQITDQLMEVFELSPEAAIAAADMSLDVSGAAARLKRLREKIAHLGEINFTALEEYEKVSEQAAFLRTQIEDLNLAKEKLEAVIHEMETTMSKRFKEAYEKVNEQFSQIFTAMFGGGAARLELSMPGRYLETGVEIVAQPPGKKERVLTLLSGGERALTAAALLFALLEVRPSPFVILDEIEAALDEANVERFAEFIKQYTNRTQFIIISHRKGTMEAASVLYGITMDANGVSKQVSVRLSDFNEG